MLQNALNDSPDIFLLGEPELDLREDAGFAARYNAMHRSWANQLTKSSFCPAILASDGSWRDYLEALAQRYRWVGAKRVVNLMRASDEVGVLFDFHCREFYDARYLFTFRDPLATVLSTRDLQLLSQGETDGLAAIMRNVVEVMGLYVRMLRNLPHVRAVFHEGVDRATFEPLEAWLGVPLPGSHLYYEAARTRTYDDTGLGRAERDSLGQIRQLHADLRGGVAEGFRIPQLEQNDNHLSPTHYTLLGSLDRRARVLERDRITLIRDFGLGRIMIQD